MDEIDLLRVRIAKAKGWIIKQEHPLVMWPNDGKYHGWTDIVPKWDSDIAAAWELVEEMRELGITTTIQNGYGVEDYGVEIFNGDGVKLEWAYGETPAEAICRAYLAWKEGQG